MTARRSELVTAAAGITGVVLVLAESATWRNPQFTDHLARITTYFVGHRSMALASLELGLAGTLVLLIFAAGLRGILRGGEGDADLLSTMALAGGLLSVSTEITFLMTTGALTFVASHGSESEIRLLLALENWIDQFRFLPIGILVGAASLAMIGGRTFRRWIGWLGIVSGGLLVVSEGANLDPLGLFGSSVSNAGQIGLPLAAIWIVAVSVSLIRRTVGAASSHPRPTMTEHSTL